MTSENLATWSRSAYADANIPPDAAAFARVLFPIANRRLSAGSESEAGSPTQVGFQPVDLRYAQVEKLAAGRCLIGGACNFEY